MIRAGKITSFRGYFDYRACPLPWQAPAETGGTVMSEFQTLSRRGRMRFWGWGLEGAALAPEEEKTIRASTARFGSDLAEVPPPTESEFALPKPRIDPPS